VRWLRILLAEDRFESERRFGGDDVWLRQTRRQPDLGRSTQTSVALGAQAHGYFLI